MDNMNRTAFLIITTIALVSVVFFLLYRTFDERLTIELLVAPGDAQIIIDNEEFSAGRLKLSEGSYIISVQRDGFEGVETAYDIFENGQVIAIALLPVTEEAFDLASQDESFLLIEEIAGLELSAEGDRLIEANPIVEYLPKSTLLYNIGYRLDNTSTSDTDIIIEIDAGDGYRELAIQEIRNLGFEPTLLNIEFRNYRNSFDE